MPYPALRTCSSAVDSDWWSTGWTSDIVDMPTRSNMIRQLKNLRLVWLDLQLLCVLPGDVRNAGRIVLLSNLDDPSMIGPATPWPCRPLRPLKRLFPWPRTSLRSTLPKRKSKLEMIRDGVFTLKQVSVLIYRIRPDELFPLIRRPCMKPSSLKAEEEKVVEKVVDPLPLGIFSIPLIWSGAPAMGQMIDEEDCKVCKPFDQNGFTYGDLVTLLFCFSSCWFRFVRLTRKSSRSQPVSKKILW